MTVIRPNSITGITSITAQANEINVFRHNGVLAGLQLNGVNHHTSAGVSTFHTVNVLGNLDVAGVLTYQDVTNVDSLGIGTFRTGINVSGGQLDVGSNIKLGNAGVITATSFVGSGANLTGLPAGTTINTNADNRLITGSGTANTLNGEATLTYDGNTLQNLQSSNSSNLTLKATSNSFNSLILDSNRSANTQFAILDGRWNGTAVARIQYVTGSDGTNKDDGYMAFHTRESGQSLTERLRIHSNGRTVIAGNASGTQPSATVGGAQFYGGSYPGDFRISSGAGASGTTTGAISIMGSNHNASIENGANSGAHLNLYNYNTTDGNSTGVMFMNSNGLAASRILGLNVSHSSRTGDLVFMTSNGSHPTEKARIKSTGEVHISDRNTSNTGDHFFQAGAFGIRMEDTGGYNRWNIERNYGGFQSTPLVHLSAQGIIGINNPIPEGVGIDVTSSRTNAFSATGDQRNLAHLILRNSSDASGRFSSLSFVSGGGTQAEGSINLVQTGNYTGDMTFKMRNGSGSNDWVQAARFLSDGDFDFNKFEPDGTITTTLSSSSSSGNYTTIIPLNTSGIGHLHVYLVSIHWSFNSNGGVPYYCSGAVLWQTPHSNSNNGVNHPITMLSSCHVGGNYHLQIRNITHGGSYPGLQAANMNWTAQSGSHYIVKYKRIY